VSERSELEPGGNVHEVVVTPTGSYSGMALIDPTSGVPYAAGASGSTGTVVVTNAPAQAVPTQVAAATVLTQASAAQTTSGASANLPVAGFRELLVAVNVTAVAGTTPTLMLAIDSLGVEGVWYTGFWASASIIADPESRNAAAVRISCIWRHGRTLGDAACRACSTARSVGALQIRRRTSPGLSTPASAPSLTNGAR